MISVFKRSTFSSVEIKLRRPGVWIAVLFIHVLLWIVFSKGDGIQRPTRSASIYLTVVLQKKNPVKPDAVRKVEVSVRRKPIKQESMQLERAAGLPELPSQAIDDRPSKPTKTLDIDAMKGVARSIAHESDRRLLPGIDRRLSDAEKFSEAMSRNKHGDCRSEYAHLGYIFAIPLLLRDAVSDKGCRW
jgi:hypothetical protein